MMLGLTERQVARLSYLRSCERSPSFIEMRDALGLKSKSGVHRLVAALEERGYIRRLPNRARAIEVVEDARLPGPDIRPAPYYLYRPHPDIVMVPLHGRIS